MKKLRHFQIVYKMANTLLLVILFHFFINLEARFFDGSVQNVDDNDVEIIYLPSDFAEPLLSRRNIPDDITYNFTAFGR